MSRSTCRWLITVEKYFSRQRGERAGPKSYICCFSDSIPWLKCVQGERGGQIIGQSECRYVLYGWHRQINADVWSPRQLPQVSINTEWRFSLGSVARAENIIIKYY